MSRAGDESLMTTGNRLEAAQLLVELQGIPSERCGQGTGETRVERSSRGNLERPESCMMGVCCCRGAAA